MDKDLLQIVKVLERLAFQVEGAIVLIKSGCVRPEQHYAAKTLSEDTFEVGDFIVSNRFAERISTWPGVCPFCHYAVEHCICKNRNFGPTGPES